jgi:hypothetical protein
MGKYRSFIFRFFPNVFFNLEINGKKERKSTGKDYYFAKSGSYCIHIYLEVY